MINFTQLGKKYNLKNSSGCTPGNVGQVMKEILADHFDLDDFDYWGKRQKYHEADTTRVRRKKLR